MAGAPRSVLDEYVSELRWRERILRDGYQAINTCMYGVEPSTPVLHEVYSLLGVYSRKIAGYGATIRTGDPMLWEYSMRFDSLEEASRALRVAADSIRVACETGCEEREGLPMARTQVSWLWSAARSLLARLTVYRARSGAHPWRGSW